MKPQPGIVILILICVALIAVLIWRQKQAVDRRTEFVEQITGYSNKVATVETESRKVIAELESDRSKQREAFSSLSNSFTEVSVSLKTAQDQAAQREAKIVDLEQQNRALDERALELSNAITNLTAQIETTRRQLAAAQGDKEVLTRELAQLMAEKADLEKKFNDISVLRAQVAKLKEEMNVSRRLDWMRKGLATAADQKGAEQLMQKVQLSGATPPPRPNYDLNVEIGTDGSVRHLPPLTNSPSR